MRLAFFLLCAAFMGCDDVTTTVAQRCDVFLYSLTPTSGQAGTPVVAAAQPLTETWDTVVNVDGAQAKIDAISRTDCGECDSCRAEQRCDSCDTCDACDDVCRDVCIQTVQFTVPDLPAGVHSVSMINQHGHSTSLPFTITEAPDTGASDTGPTDPEAPSGDSGETSAR